MRSEERMLTTDEREHAVTQLRELAEEVFGTGWFSGPTRDQRERRSIMKVLFDLMERVEIMETNEAGRKS